MYWPFGPVWSWCTGPLGQFGHDILALRASLVMMYWPFGSVWSWCIDPSGQFGPDVQSLPASLDVLALWASLVMIYQKVGSEFNFKAFSRMILTRISIELQLIDSSYNKRHRSRKLIYLNSEGFFSMYENVFSEKWSISELKMMYWPFGPVWSWCTGPSGQFSHDALPMRARLVLM